MVYSPINVHGAEKEKRTLLNKFKTKHLCLADELHRKSQHIKKVLMLCLLQSFGEPIRYHGLSPNIRDIHFSVTDQLAHLEIFDTPMPS